MDEDSQDSTLSEDEIRQIIREILQPKPQDAVTFMMQITFSQMYRMYMEKLQKRTSSMSDEMYNRLQQALTELLEQFERNIGRLLGD